MRIAPDGNVGIGVTSVGTKLHVVSGTDNNIATDVSEIRFIGADKPITGEQANVVIQTNDDMAADKGGSIGFGGRHTTSSTNGSNFAHISGRKENSTSANFAGYLSFGTADSASDIHERMRIDSSGRVGIGTTSMGAPLHITNATPVLRFTDSDTSRNSQIVGIDGNLRFDADNDNQQSSTNISFRTDGTERARIDSSGNFGIGTTSPDSNLQIMNNDGSSYRFGYGGSSDVYLDADNVYIRTDNGGANTATFTTTGLGIGTTSPTDVLTVAGNITVSDGSPEVTFQTGASHYNWQIAAQENTNSAFEIAVGSQDADASNDTFSPLMTVLQSGNVGIGTTAPDRQLSINDFSGNGTLSINASTSGASTVYFADGSSGTSIYAGYIQYSHADNSMQFATNGGSERMRIDSSGNVLVGKTSLDNGTIGTEIKFNGGLINVTNSAAQCMTINRLTSDGMLVLFQQDTNSEGSIQVSGSTVSYNGFSGNHESSGIASDTAKGTVCSTIDELDTYVSGTKEGQTRTDHAKIKVSDTVGDARVYGVLSSYSETDNKPIVASVGIGSVLVTGACEGGDLLESNGDGTAKVQDDDIIRSKTIGKVTIGNLDTNVKLVSCVLYCG